MANRLTPRLELLQFPSIFGIQLSYPLINFALHKTTRNSRMPQIYTTRPEPPSRSLSSASFTTASSIPPRVIDTDDTIMLSDLVRTGEASRLRRRGAMRLDHNSGHNVQPRNIVVVDRPIWDSDYENDFDLSEGHLGSSGRSSSMRYTRRRQRSMRYGPYATTEEQADEAMYTIVCGAESFGPCDLEPFKPSILPLYPPLQDDGERVTSKRSTGCGSIVHMRASPRPRIGFWSACGPASTVVVPLDVDYFDSIEVGRRVRASCGCLKEGIGCSVCGNTLGTRFVPCKSASDGFYCSKHTDKSHMTRLRGPEGPQYWQASTYQTSDHTIYSFFSDAVTSTPGYSFPSQRREAHTHRLYNAASEDSLNFSSYSPPIPHLPDSITSDDEEQSYGGEWHQSNFITQDRNPSANLLQAPANMILDRWVTASPTPLSENGDETDLPPPVVSQAPRQHNHPDVRRPFRSHTAPPAVASPIAITTTTTTQTTYEDSSASFYQQQVLGAWERERERELLDPLIRQHGGGQHAPVDQGSGNVVWGVVETRNSTPEIEEPGSPDKTNEHFILPPR